MTKKRQPKPTSTSQKSTSKATSKPTSKPPSKATTSSPLAEKQNKNSVVAKQNEEKKKSHERKQVRETPVARTATGRVPKGRTLTTRDKHLDKKAKEPEKERPVVVIEANESNELAVVALTSRAGKDRTKLNDYQQGQSYFKHYIEVEDSEGNAITIGEKFKENHPNMDVLEEDVERITDKVLNHSKASSENKKKILTLKNGKEKTRPSPVGYDCSQNATRRKRK